MKTGIVKPIDIRKVMRFDGSYHLADSQIYEKLIYSRKWQLLGALTSSIFTSGRNKRMYTAPQYGYPFLSNSDVVSANPFLTCKYDSIKYNHDPSGFLKDGMIVTGRVGAIGQTAFISKRFEDNSAIGSDNIIRIVCSPEVKNGYVYAFLASKIGNLMFWKHSTGGVQPYITDKMVANIPVPVFPEEMQEEIDKLIRDAASLRDKAAELFDKAKSILQKNIEVVFEKTNGLRTASTSIKDIRSSLKMRLDPPVFVNDGVEMLGLISDKTQPLKECDVTLSYPGMFKRSYVKDGYPYMKGSDIFDVNPFAHCEYLSKTRTPNIEQLWLKDGLILISCAGACGLVKLITKEYEDKQAIGSPDIIRLKSNDSLFTSEYLFTYLSLPSSYDYMQSLKYGAVIERFDVQNIETVPILIPTKELSATITELIREYKDCIYKAFCKEEAISMVEAEIESWDKNKSKK